jgi:hypothetical protein
MRLMCVLLNDKSRPGFLIDFQDGQSRASHYLFGNSSKFSIMIQLFYDGMRTTNPLRGQSVMCNVGVFYYVVKNLPPFYNSCYANVHLLALCYSADLKTYGFDPILEKFVAEIRHLRTVGYSGNFPILGNRQGIAAYALCLCPSCQCQLGNV